MKVNFCKETFPTPTYSYLPLKPVFLPTPLYVEDASLKRRFHGGFISVARSAWKPLDQWEHSF
jgi:hypothetical protein